MRVLVMGATGNVGSPVLRGLLERDVTVRAVSRSVQEWPPGVEALVADPNRPDGLRGALEGVDKAFVMSGYAAEAGLLEGAAGVHVVLLSSSSAPLSHANAMASMHHASEEAVRHSAGSWTFLRPCSFQSNLLRWRDQLRDGDVVRAPFADVATAMIDPADIAAVAVEALSSDAHAGRVLRISGPEALTPPQQVDALGKALGRSLACSPMSDDEAVADMGGRFGSAARNIFRDHPDLEGEVQPTVAQVLGRPPRPLTSWLEAHRDAF